MSQVIYVCEMCHRIVEDTKVIGGVMRIRVPLRHRTREDEICDSERCEVITAWK